MCAFIAALPFRNFARFGFREVRGELDFAERRRRRVFAVRPEEDFEARFLRRRRPPTRNPFDCGPMNGRNIPDIHRSP